MKSAFSVLSILLMSSIGFAQAVVPAGQGDEAMLGKGYNPDTQTFEGRCLKGKTEEYGRPAANVDFTQSLSQSDLASELGFGAGGRFRYGIGTVSASAKFFRQQQGSSFSISAVYSGEYKFKNLVLNFEDTAPSQSTNNAGLVRARLSDVGRSVYSNDQKWLDTCGTEYVEQIERGAKLFYSIRIDFSSTEEKQVFESAFSYDSSFASAQAYLRTASRNFSKNTKVTIGALQIGGDVSKVTELFNAESDNQSALGFVQCSFGDFSKCDKVMETAWNYATKEFKKQLDTAPSSAKPGTGPAYLAYRTKEYSAAGIYGNLPSIVNYAIQKSRKQLEKYFDKQIDYLGEIRHLLHGKTVLLSPRQRKDLTELENTASSNLEAITAVAKLCFDTPADCIEAVDSLGDQDDGIKPVDESKLVITPETFQQFCSFAQTPVAPESLRQSIHGMIEAAKEINETAFQTNSNGRTDPCLISHMIFSQTNTVSFAGKGIRTLEPLREYKNFISLDLSENEIEDLSPLADLQNLVELNLHKNKVRDISPLTNLRSLEKLRISNNSLRDIDGLKTIPSLVRVDARNNFPTVTCTGLSQIEVCLSASVRTDANFVPVPTKSSTPFFMPSLAQLPDSRILAIGLGKLAQIFEPNANTFVSTGEIGLPSYGHVSIALGDGRVLVSGGWGSLRRLAIYKASLGGFVASDVAMQVPRAGHQATLLKDGRVLITGGWEGGGSWTGSNASYTAEIFDPTARTSTLLPHMHAPRAWHTATLLPDGRVLIAGGFSHGGSLATSEIFDPATNRFLLLKNSMSEGRGAHTATLLEDGRVLMVGGFNNAQSASSTAEIFDPAREAYQRLPEPLNQARGAHAALKLKNGKVLVTGGSTDVYAPSSPLDSSSVFLDSGELYDPLEGSFTEIPAKMYIPRANHAMVEIKEGLVLVVGGLSWDAAYNSEVFTYTDVVAPSPLR